MHLRSGNEVITKIEADLVVVGRFSSEGTSADEAALDGAVPGQLGLE